MEINEKSDVIDEAVNYLLICTRKKLLLARNRIGMKDEGIHHPGLSICCQRIITALY
jgi:hypothetical protein